MQTRTPLPAGTRWWILCRVVDNYGDAGVCWRLARQLACEHGAEVTLFIDRPELIDRLAGGRPEDACPGGSSHPGTAPFPGSRAKALAGVRVAPWPDAPPSGRSDPAPASRPAPAPVPCPEVVLSAFGCEPPPWIRAMLAGGPSRPLWINLEYLSAEPWVDGCHRLASVKGDGAVEHFFYPGFTPTTGGLLRERNALAPLAPPDGTTRAGAIERLCGQVPESGERIVTMFCYPDSPLASLLRALAESRCATLLLVPDGVAPGEPEAFAGAGLAPGGPAARTGRLRIARIPFLPQDSYDLLLRLADLNFVRGEDSFVRAHWARRPFVWQPYRQQEDAHRDKLEAFLLRLRQAAIAAGDPPSAIDSIEAMMRAWSGGSGDIGAAWRNFVARRRAIEAVFGHWVDFLGAQADLAWQLTEFVRGKL